MKLDKAMLVLEDGTEFAGWAFGKRGEAIGEVVFHTGMTGYQEILTDPSYCGQIVTMTYPEIGNTGINREDMESKKAWLEGFVVKECIDQPSNYRSEQSLPEFMQQQGIPGIQGIDTRFLTRHIRTHGAQAGIISSVDLDPASLLKKVRNAPGIVGRDMVECVTCGQSYEFYEGLWQWDKGLVKPEDQPRFKVVALDFGIKTNILRHMAERGIHVTVMPASTTAEAILELKPDGLFLSNGPGDPAGLPYAADAVRQVADAKPGLPIMGICLGHQIIGRAFGALTIKLKFGHHGANHPVLDMDTGEISITSQNHGFAVPVDFFDKIGKQFIYTHKNLNDQTVEGMRHRERPIFSVQYHPEASPGPHDASYLFDRFIDLMEEA